MRLNIFTIALDSMPWIGAIFAELNRCDLDWRWVIAHGRAIPVKDTKWMRYGEPGLSKDGTTEFLKDLETHPRIRVIHKEKWIGKTEMCNEAISCFEQRGLLLQMDSDELWTASQLEILVEVFRMHRDVNGARFKCRYFVGPNLVTTGENCYGCNRDEWMRAWRWCPGMTFETHEPPVLDGNKPVILSREDTQSIGLVFDHYSWATYAQVAIKEKLYGYQDARRGFRQLPFVVKDGVHPLKKFFPWVDNKVGVTPVFN